jgi:hypothetical protein
LNQISLRYEFGEDPAALWLMPDDDKKIDKALIQEKKYLNTNRYVEVVLFPEER